MHEVLTRRFTHGMREQEEMQEKELGAEYGSFTRFPDLIMMDGGCLLYTSLETYQSCVREYGPVEEEGFPLAVYIEKIVPA